ncbi:unnamed protein product [Caenorhabditis nigoni]
MALTAPKLNRAKFVPEGVMSDWFKLFDADVTDSHLFKMIREVLAIGQGSGWYRYDPRTYLVLQNCYKKQEELRGGHLQTKIPNRYQEKNSNSRGTAFKKVLYPKNRSGRHLLLRRQRNCWDALPYLSNNKSSLLPPSFSPNLQVLRLLSTGQQDDLLNRRHCEDTLVILNTGDKLKNVARIIKRLSHSWSNCARGVV